MINWFIKNNYLALIGKVNKNNKPAIFFHKAKGNSLTKSENIEDPNYNLTIDLQKFR